MVSSSLGLIMTTEKKFCSECHWFFTHCADWGTIVECNAPDNFEDTYRFRGSKYLKDPRDRNKHNSCTLYVPKGPTFSERFLIRLAKWSKS